MKTKGIHKKINMKRRQSGITSLLFILLVGMTLTVATIGYVASVKTMQSSAVTTHAQTQAQMQTMVGYQALSEFLKSSNMDMAKIAATTTGTVTSTTGTVINYNKSPSCPSGMGNYCFDIIGESGGAKAILRALFKVTDTVTTSTVTGSIFASGLKVFGSAEFSGIVGDNVSIAVGGANAGTITGGGTVRNITVTTYLGGINIPDAMSLKSDANYIFEKSPAGAAICSKINLSGTSNITTKTSITCPSGVSLSRGVWTFDSSAAQLAGITWFDGDVNLTMKKKNDQIASNAYTRNDDIINTIIATGTIKSVQPNGNQHGAEFHAYAPYHYLLEANDANILARLNKVCPANNYPTQYCKPHDAILRDNLSTAGKPVGYSTMAYFNANKSQFIKDMDSYPANLANILLLTDTGFEFNSSPRAPMFLYGNMIGSRGAGGTGSASGKFVGNANINVFGNILVTGDQTTDMTQDPTQMGGNVNVTLGKAKGGGNTIPTSVKSVTPASISYP